MGLVYADIELINPKEQTSQANENQCASG